MQARESLGMKKPLSRHQKLAQTRGDNKSVSHRIAPAGIVWMALKAPRLPARSQVYCLMNREGLPNARSPWNRRTREEDCTSMRTAPPDTRSQCRPTPRRRPRCASRDVPRHKSHCPSPSRLARGRTLRQSRRMPRVSCKTHRLQPWTPSW